MTAILSWVRRTVKNRDDSRDRRHTKYRPTHYTGHCWSRSAERLLKGRVAELTGSPAATMD